MQTAVPIKARVESGFINQVQMFSKICLMNIRVLKLKAR
jgi:hypothetical protein